MDPAFTRWAAWGSTPVPRVASAGKAKRGPDRLFRGWLPVAEAPPRRRYTCGTPESSSTPGAADAHLRDRVPHQEGRLRAGWPPEQTGEKSPLQEELPRPKPTYNELECGRSSEEKPGDNTLALEQQGRRGGDSRSPDACKQEHQHHWLPDCFGRPETARAKDGWPCERRGCRHIRPGWTTIHQARGPPDRCLRRQHRVVRRSSVLAH